MGIPRGGLRLGEIPGEVLEKLAPHPVDRRSETVFVGPLRRTAAEVEEVAEEVFAGAASLLHHQRDGTLLVLGEGNLRIRQDLLDLAVQSRQWIGRAFHRRERGRLGRRAGGPQQQNGERREKGSQRERSYFYLTNRWLFRHTTFDWCCDGPAVEDEDHQLWRKRRDLIARPGVSAGDCANTSHHGDVLAAVEAICDRRPHAAAQSGLEFEQLLAFVRAVGEQPAIAQCLEDEIPRGRQRAAADAAAPGTPPAHLLLHRIPRDQRAASARSFDRRRADRRRRWAHWCRRRSDGAGHAAWLRVERRLGRIREAVVRGRGNVDEPGRWIE